MPEPDRNNFIRYSTSVNLKRERYLALIMAMQLILYIIITLIFIDAEIIKKISKDFANIWVLYIIAFGPCLVILILTMREVKADKITQTHSIIWGVDYPVDIRCQNTLL